MNFCKIFADGDNYSSHCVLLFYAHKECKIASPIAGTLVMPYRRRRIIKGRDRGDGMGKLGRTITGRKIG